MLMLINHFQLFRVMLCNVSRDTATIEGVRLGGGSCDSLLRVRGQLECDGTRAETRFRLPAKRLSPFKSAGASVQSTTGNRGVRISGSNAGYTMFRCSVRSSGYPLHSPVSPSLPLPCVTVFHHISAGVLTVVSYGLSPAT